MSVDDIGRLPLRIIVPITDWKNGFVALSWFVHLPASVQNGLDKDSAADAFQVKSVSENRFVRKLMRLDADQFDEVVMAIALCVGAS